MIEDNKAIVVLFIFMIIGILIAILYYGAIVFVILWLLKLFGVI